MTSYICLNGEKSYAKAGSLVHCCQNEKPEGKNPVPFRQFEGHAGAT